MKRTYLAATAIAAAFIVWVLSSPGSEARTVRAPPPPWPKPALEEEAAVAADAPVRVRAQILQSQPISAGSSCAAARRWALRRRTQQSTQARGRAPGREGRCGRYEPPGRLDAEARPALFEESRAQLAQARIDHEGSSLKLQREGLYRTRR